MSSPVDGDAIKRRAWDIAEAWRNQGRDYEALLLESVVEQIVDTEPTLTPQNEPLTLEQIKSLYDSPAWYQDLYRKMGYWVIVGVIGEIGVHLTDIDNANEFYSTIDYGARWALFRRPPERQEDT